MRVWKRRHEVVEHRCRNVAKFASSEMLVFVTSANELTAVLRDHKLRERRLPLHVHAVERDQSSTRTQRGICEIEQCPRFVVIEMMENADRHHDVKIALAKRLRVHRRANEIAPRSPRLFRFFDVFGARIKPIYSTSGRNSMISAGPQPISRIFMPPLG